MDLSKYKSVIFDCDGVVLQSNHIKTNAFRKVLSDEPSDLVDRFISYHKHHGGVSRYIKFNHYYNNIKHEEENVIMVKKTLERYANIVTDELMKADYVPGVVKVINYLNRRNVPCFIVSGSDENELNHVLSLRKIADKFCKILGSPATKIENMERIKDYGGLYYPAVLFGDAKIDMQVAQKYGIDFCYISGFSDWNCSDASIEDLGYTVLYDFNEVVNT